MTHPDDALLLQWLDGELAPGGDPGDEAGVAYVTAHVAACARCAAVVASARSTGGALRRWAEVVAVPTDDLADAVMRALENRAPAPPAPSTVKSVPEARAHSARVIPLRRWIWPALAAAAAMVVMMSPRIPRPHSAVRKEPTPHIHLPADALASGADVVSVQVEGAKSSTVLEIEGSGPKATSAVVWIQDEPDDPPSEPTAVD